jgi:hypothetical protein
VEFFDVFMVKDFGPVLFEDASTEFVDFTLEGDFKSGAFKADVKSANPTEKGGSFETWRFALALPSVATRPAINLDYIWMSRHR